MSEIAAVPQIADAPEINQLWIHPVAAPACWDARMRSLISFEDDQQFSAIITKPSDLTILKAGLLPNRDTRQRRHPREDRAARFV
jgi:hypothetical protein